MGGRGRRLRGRRWNFQRQLCLRRRCPRCSAGRSPHSRLPAIADGPAEGTAGVAGACRQEAPLTTRDDELILTVASMGLENAVFQIEGGGGLGLTYVIGALVKV